MRRWIPALAGLALLGGSALLGGCTATADPAAAPPAPTRAATAPASGNPTSGPTAAVVANPQTSWDVNDFPDPCRTITNAEVAGVLGPPVNPGLKLDSWPPLCQFVLNPQARTYLYVSDDSTATSKDDFERKRALSTQNQAISGLGDEAYWQPDIASLNILSGQTHVFVAFGGKPAPDGAKDKALAIANIILPRAKP